MSVKNVKGKLMNIFPKDCKNQRRSWELLKRLRAETPPWSQHPTKFSGHKYCEKGDIDFSNHHLTLRWSRHQRVMWLYGWEPLTVSCHPTKLGVDWHCSWRYNGFSLSHDLAVTVDLIMWHHGWESIIISRHLTKFSIHRNCSSEDIIVLLCHMIFQDHVTKDLCYFMDRCPSW